MGHTSELDRFINLHKNQLISAGIPERFWKTLSEKIQNQIFNPSDTFQLMQIHYEEEKKPHEPSWALQATSKIEKLDSKHVYLIDHTWTFRVGYATNQLLQFDSLCNRLCNILGLDGNLPKEDLVSQIFANIWKICRMYSIGNALNIEDRLPVWYVMDEIGSAVMHNDTPNCRIVPFFYVTAQITYSLLFPIEDIDAEEFIFADFAEGVHEKIERLAALLPWVPHSFKDLSFKPKMPGPDYYLSGHIEETLPVAHSFPITKKKYTVYSEYDLVKRFLTSNKFELVDNEALADILWYTKHFKNFAHLSKTPDKFVNQFPYEYVVTIKDLLSLTCRKFLNCGNNTLESLKWFPITYNLKTEIGNFVAYFQYRDLEGLDNYWIIKPYNLARSLDIHITNNLNYIMRLPATGPKIVQKYITNPVLFFRPECEGSVKFDIRYVILLQNIKPLRCYSYKQFFVRFANKPFELNDFHDFEKHFTVMNYDDNITMKHMLCAEFKMMWKEQYPLHDWDSIEKNIAEMLKNTFKCATKDSPPCGIAQNPQSRALYAADIMLEWNEEKEMQPKLLEINWIPDCKRACEYYPDFFNDIFELLFLNEVSANILEL